MIRLALASLFLFILSLVLTLFGAATVAKQRTEIEECHGKVVEITDTAKQAVTRLIQTEHIVDMCLDEIQNVAVSQSECKTKLDTCMRR